MSRTSRIAAVVLAIVLIAEIACIAAALADLRPAPSFIQLMVIAWAGLIAAIVLMIASLRQFKRESDRQRRIVWSTESAIPPELDAERRRAMQPLAGPSFALPSFLFIGVALLMMLTVTYPQAREWGALRNRGIETIGNVTGKRSHTRKRTFYYLDYEFRKGIRTIADSARVDRERWNETHIGDRIAVIYLSRSPRISLPRERAEMTPFDVFEPEMLMMLCAISLLLTAAPLLLRFAQSRIPRLVRNGTAGIGTITAIHGAYAQYTFRHDERDVKSRFLWRSAAITGPAIGDTFVVLYNPKRPSENIAWPIARASFEGEPPTTPAPDIDVNAPFRVTLSWHVPLFLLFCVALATPFVVVTNHARKLHATVAHLQANGVETWGTVVTMFQIGDGNWTRIRFHYRDLDAIYLTSSMRIQERFRQGSPTPVTYAMDDPTIALPFRRSELNNPRITEDVIPDLIIGAFVLTGVALLVVYIGWRTFAEWRLAHGSMRIATVIEVRGRILRKCRYRFMADHGEVEHEVRVQWAPFRPAAGDRIAIVSAGARSAPIADLVFVRRRASPASESRDA